MKGDELVERLRVSHPESRVLYMSGYAEDEDVTSGKLSKHGEEWIAKPFSPHALAERIRRVLDA